MAPRVDKDKEEGLTRIAIVNPEKCKPSRCRGECKKICPVNKMGKQCIVVTPSDQISQISEALCVGCGMCVKKCPFTAIQIINIPASLEKETTHRYGENLFKLHRLPLPRPGQVLGLVGSNGTGKSTAMKILSGKMKPNLGLYTKDKEPKWSDVLLHFRGSELQNYFTKILQDEMKAIIKPQYVDHIPRAVKGKVREILASKDDRQILDAMLRDMDLAHVAEREIAVLSGGELQRFAIATVAVQKANVYMFDEPSSYLDIKQRLYAAWMIRSMLDVAPGTYVICVEHDLSVLDYLSDYICVLYGEPGAYGVVTMPFAVRDGINIFLGGFVPTENLRFRVEELTFKFAQTGLDTGDRKPRQQKKKGGEGDEEEQEGEGAAADKGAKEKKKEDAEVAEAEERRQLGVYKYPRMTKTLTGGGGPESSSAASAAAASKEEEEEEDAKKKKAVFSLTVEPGEFRDSEIVVLLGENGTGKTTFIRMLAGNLAADVAPGQDKPPELPKLGISYKPQKISPKFEGSVRDLLQKKILAAFNHPQFQTDVLKPMKIESIIDQQVLNLSGGELQRVAITICLGTPADVYLIDEPSAYLDSEQRVITAKVIKRFIVSAKKTCFIVEHDFIMSTYLADRVIVYEGRPGVSCKANSPCDLLTGMNTFLKSLQVTFRRDPTNNRPRINKRESVKDQEQKKSGNFFFMEATD